MTNSSACVTSAFSQMKALLPVLALGCWLPGSQLRASARATGAVPTLGHIPVYTRRLSWDPRVRSLGGHRSCVAARRVGISAPLQAGTACPAQHLSHQRHVPAQSLSSSISSLGLAGSSSAGTRKARWVAGRINSLLPSRNGGKGSKCKVQRLPTCCPALRISVSEGKRRREAAIWRAPASCSWFNCPATGQRPPGAWRALYPTALSLGPMP